MKKCILLMVLFNTCLLFSQTVSNVAFTQRTDGSLKVDITYDLVSSEAVTITVEASNNGGSTWNLTCTSLTGAVGQGVTAGTGKSIEWDFYADNPGQSGDNYVVKVTAAFTGTMTGNDGTIYQTVKIGDQWWMAENLKETKYRNGNAIPEVTDDATWRSLTTGARCSYDNNAGIGTTYGYLYNWYAAVDARNIAPSGWRVPTDADWTALVNYLSGSTVAGGKLKETGYSHWFSPNTGATDESGFSALPGGFRTWTSTFANLGSTADFWSATEDSNPVAALMRRLFNNSTTVTKTTYQKVYGFSVRLIKN